MISSNRWLQAFRRMRLLWCLLFQRHPVPPQRQYQSTDFHGVKTQRSQYEILVELLSTHKIMSSDVQNSAECKCKGKSRIRHWNRHRPLPFTSSPWTPPTFTLRRILTVLFPYSVLTGWSLLCSRSVSCEVTMEYYSKNFPDCCPQVSMYRAFLVFLSLQANAEMCPKSLWHISYAAILV
jgi:hypothetical protein